MPAVDPRAPLRILLAAPRGFCAGVERAVRIVEIALERYGAPVYVRHAIVHNHAVVDRLEGKGAIFVEDESAVPRGGLLVLSAHGVAPSVRANAQRRGLRVLDATCPLVTKVHLGVRKAADEGRTVVLIGHAGHQEVIGTMGEAPEHVVLVQNAADVAALRVADPQRVTYASQTTLAVDETAEVVAALRARFPALAAPRGDDICYATQNRQDAVKHIAERVPLVLVVGSAHSSNSQRMVEVAADLGIRAHLVDDVTALRAEWFTGIDALGLTSGASAPEWLVQQIIDHLRAQPRGAEVEQVELAREDINFSLPAALRSAGGAQVLDRT